MKTGETQTKQKRIEDLTLRELDMVYSLVRVGEWPDSDIARRYRVLESDVKKIVESYAELRRTVERNLSDEGLRQDPPQELPEKKPRKRRRDARFATPAERQAAYRSRVKEKRRAAMQQLPASSDTDSRSPAHSELIGNGLPAPVAETDSHCADTELLT